MTKKKPENKSDYFDDALIKLRRVYGKDEAVAALSKKLSETEIELGKAVSYIQELEHENEKIKLQNGEQIWIEKYQKLKKNFDNLNKAHSEVHKKINKVKKDNADLIYKILCLEKKV
jgi:predicted nuclease with TOPRIM domain